MADPPIDQGDLMEYRGYKAEIVFDEDEDTFVGHVVNVPKRDAVLIRGRSVDELREDLAGQIELYESIFRGAGREPAPVG